MGSSLEPSHFLLLNVSLVFVPIVEKYKLNLSADMDLGTDFRFITHADDSRGVGRSFSCICLCVCHSVCTITQKPLEISTPNLVKG